MTEVVDMLVKPILMMPPIFSLPPVTSVICGIVSIIKGGALEKVPGIGDMIKYVREFIMIGLIIFFIYIKVMQFIGPKLWHFSESIKWRHPKKPTPLKTTSAGDDDDTAWWEYIPVVAAVEAVAEVVEAVESAEDGWTYFIEWIAWVPRGIQNWSVTVFQQIPIDVLSWDMESLSLDFGSEWGDPSNILREDCRRFINGSYAGDYSLYERETIETYYSDTHEGTDNDIYKNSATGSYLCSHGAYCEQLSDVFGRTLLGMNASDTDDSPANGYINGTNISSAPRKYATCCSGIPITDCNEHCRGDNPIDLDNLRDPKSLITDLEQMALHPIKTYEEILDVFKHLPPGDYEAIRCNFHNSIYDWWYEEGCCGCDAYDRYIKNHLPCPDTLFFHRGPTCTESWSDIGRHIKAAYDIRVQQCKSTCDTENDTLLNRRGCNSLNIDQAKRSVLRNRNDVLDAHIKRKRGGDYGTISNKKKQYIKKTPWKQGGNRPALNLGPSPYEADRSQERTDQLKIEGSGTLCNKHDLSEAELDECFGPFKPMTPEQYPVLFKNIIKEFMGSVLWYLFIALIIFIILYILCLLNPIGRAAYKGDHGPALDSLPKFLRNKLNN